MDRGEARLIGEDELVRLAADIPDLRARLGLQCAPSHAALVPLLLGLASESGFAPAWADLACCERQGEACARRLQLAACPHAAWP